MPGMVGIVGADGGCVWVPFQLTSCSLYRMLGVQNLRSQTGWVISSRSSRSARGLKQPPAPPMAFLLLLPGALPHVLMLLVFDSLSF